MKDTTGTIDTVDIGEKVKEKFASGIYIKLFDEYNAKTTKSFVDLIKLHENVYKALGEEPGLSNSMKKQLIAIGSDGIKKQLQLEYPLSQGVVDLYIKYPEIQQEFEDLYKKYPAALTLQMKEIVDLKGKSKADITVSAEEARKDGIKSWEPGFDLQYLLSAKLYSFLIPQLTIGDEPKGRLNGLYPDIEKKDLARLSSLFTKVAVAELQDVLGYVVGDADIKALKKAGADAKALSGKAFEYSPITKPLTNEVKITIIQNYDNALMQIGKSLDNDHSLNNTKRDKLKADAKKYIESQQKAYTGEKNPAAFIKQNVFGILKESLEGVQASAKKKAPTLENIQVKQPDGNIYIKPSNDGLESFKILEAELKQKGIKIRKEMVEVKRLIGSNKVEAYVIEKASFPRIVDDRESLIALGQQKPRAAKTQTDTKAHEIRERKSSSRPGFRQRLASKRKEREIESKYL
jgi:hypothetical protein